MTRYECDKCHKQTKIKGFMIRMRVKNLPCWEDWVLEKPVEKSECLYGYKEVKLEDLAFDLCPHCAAELLNPIIPGIYVRKDRLDREKKKGGKRQ